MTQLIAVDTPATISATFYAAGADTGADDGTVTVAVMRADGSAVTGVGAVTSAGDGVYTVTLPAQADLDVLTATWTGATTKVRTTHEIVGRQLVELAEIRAQTNLSSASYTNTMLEDARAWFLDTVDDFCGFSPIPRYAYETASGDGTSTVRITNRAYVRAIRSVAVDGEEVGDLTGWDLDNGLLSGTTFPYGRNNVTVGYEYGLDHPPADLKRAALTAIRYRLLTDVNSQLPDRAMSISNEYGNIQMAQPNRKGPTGIPEVDAVLMRYRLVTVG